MRRRPIIKRCRSIFHGSSRRRNRLSGISTRFRELSRSWGQVAYVLLTRPPLTLPRRARSARLACIRHAASVRPEPGSNSPNWLVDRETSLYPKVRLKFLVCSLLFYRFSINPWGLTGQFHSLFSFQRTSFSFSPSACFSRPELEYTMLIKFMQVFFYNC